MNVAFALIDGGNHLAARQEINEKVKLSIYLIFGIKANVKVDLINSTLIQKIGEVNKINDKTDHAVSSIMSLSMGMQKKSTDIRKNAEVNQIFSRYI